MIDRSERRSPAVAARTAFVMALVVFGVVFIANSWVGDDAFISFRVSDNIIHGYGPRWNVAERVQAFTNPLWTLVMAAVPLALITGVVALVTRSSQRRKPAQA